jgi:hypothetical protein
MATLSENGKELIMEDGSAHNVEKSFVHLECGKVDLQNAQNRISFAENLISQARKLGYLTQVEIDEIEQKKYKEEREAQEKAEKKAKKLKEVVNE